MSKGQVTPHIDVGELTPRPLTEKERAEVVEGRKALDKIFADAKKGRFKIEVLFGSARSMHKPTPGIVCFWESGAKLHGGGDSKVYICPGKHLGANTCEAPIPDDGNGFGNLVCPKCGYVWKADQVIGEILANLSLRAWSEVLLKYFALLGHNADIYLKYAKDDIRYAANIEQSKQAHGELLSKARSEMVPSIYPLNRIIADTAAGADLAARFFAFVTA